jgi:hypothetical protein
MYSWWRFSRLRSTKIGECSWASDRIVRCAIQRFSENNRVMSVTGDEKWPYRSKLRARKSDPLSRSRNYPTSLNKKSDACVITILSVCVSPNTSWTSLYMFTLSTSSCHWKWPRRHTSWSCSFNHHKMADAQTSQAEAKVASVNSGSWHSVCWLDLQR